MGAIKSAVAAAAPAALAPVPSAGAAAPFTGDATYARAPPAVPTWLPAAVEKQVNTRAAAHAAEKRQRYAREVTVQYSLCNEPWLKYAPHVVADKGLRPSQWTAARLRKDAIYLETRRTRYELAWDSSSASPEGGGDHFCWSECPVPLPLVLLRAGGVPMPKAPAPQGAVSIEEKLGWEEVQWGVHGVVVRGIDYPVTRLQFVERTTKITGR